jgi:hypothetical protein
MSNDPELAKNQRNHFQQHEISLQTWTLRTGPIRTDQNLAVNEKTLAQRSKNENTASFLTNCEVLHKQAHEILRKMQPPGLRSRSRPGIRNHAVEDRRFFRNFRPPQAFVLEN